MQRSGLVQFLRTGYRIAPLAFVWTVWFLYMTATQKWGIFLAHSEAGIQNWYMSLTMLFGSFVAGATSEGGGAVAFPVMTLLFEVDPPVARNFSLAIQSIGMTSAAFFILVRRIPIARSYLVLCSLGGSVGIIVGTYFVYPFVSPDYIKMLFVTLWLSFGVVLFYANVFQKRKTIESLPKLPRSEQSLLMGVGFIGGIVSALAGSGLDISSFAFVTTRYNLSEKVATPTSVCLMAGNSLVGFMLHAFVIQDFFNSDAFSYWLVAIPVAMIMAPLGAFFISQQTQQFVANFLYVILIVQFVSAFFILRPTGALLGFTGLVFVFGITLFMGFGTANLSPQRVYQSPPQIYSKRLNR